MMPTRRVAAPSTGRNVRSSRRAPRRYVKKSKKVSVTSLQHRFTRWYDSGTFAGNVVNAPLLQSASFALNALPNVSEFANLFDQYKITHVQLRFHLNVDPSAQAAGSAVYPKLYYATDFDDANAPASFDDLRQHARLQVRVMNPNRPIVVNIKPAVTTLVYRGPTTSSYVPKWRQFIDMAQTDVPHYGLKWAIDNLTNTNYSVKIEGRMWFTCKDVR